MIKFSHAVAIGIMCLASVPALAERPHVVGPIPGYRCMMLNITEAQALDPTFHTAVYAGASASTPITGYAALEVAVRNPPHVVNGFEEALFPTGSTVWIKAGELRPYHSLSDPTADCVPAMLSNGVRGFDYPHRH